MIQTNHGFLATPDASVFATLITQPTSSSRTRPAPSSNQQASSSNQPMEIVEPEIVPMETVNLSKQNVYAETGTPEGPKKRGRKRKGDDVSMVKNIFKNPFIQKQ